MIDFVELATARRPKQPDVAAPPAEARPQADWRICPVTGRPVLAWALPAPASVLVAKAA